MAIYRCSVSIIKRSAGRTATAAAAYRATERVVDERTGEIHDYTRKEKAVHTEILAPQTVPQWVYERQALWNAVEWAERRKDAQLARELQLAIPHELSAEQGRSLVREFVNAELVARGMIADIAIHRPHRANADERNWHAHVLVTMREITADGFGKKVREWNRKSVLKLWRKNWEEHVNRALERAGIDVRVDHRSYRDQALAAGHDVRHAAIAQPKLGPKVLKLERQGIRTERGDLYRDWQRLGRLRKELSQIDAEVIGLEREQRRAGEQPEQEQLDCQQPSELQPMSTGLLKQQANWLRRQAKRYRQVERSDEQIRYDLRGDYRDAVQQAVQVRAALEEQHRRRADLQQAYEAKGLVGWLPWEAARAAAGQQGVRQSIAKLEVELKQIGQNLSEWNTHWASEAGQQAVERERQRDRREVVRRAELEAQAARLQMQIEGQARNIGPDSAACLDEIQGLVTENDIGVGEQQNPML